MTKTVIQTMPGVDEALGQRGLESTFCWNKQHQTGRKTLPDFSAESLGPRGPGFKSRHSDHGESLEPQWF